MASAGTLPPDPSFTRSADQPTGSPSAAFARGAMESVTERASTLVAQRPVASLLLAAGAGAIVGWLVKR
jgi:hypothetical protein